MKVTVIGDTHGRDFWLKIIKRNRGSHFIFLGDYLDAYKAEKISEEAAIENFKNIIQFKKSNPNKVTLLIGNHDAQYLYFPLFGTGARSKKYLMDIIDIFKQNKQLFQFAYQRDEYLFTHAGVSNDWFLENRKVLEQFGLKEDLSNLGDALNKAGSSRAGIDIFDRVSSYRGGFDENGSPLWADTMELYRDNLDGFHQIVGHNKFNDIMGVGDDNQSITFCDCLFNVVKELNIDI